MALLQIYGVRTQLTQLETYLSGQEQVNSMTPPTFLLESWDDRQISSQNSSLFYEALNTAGVPSEGHIFQKGLHGDGLAKGQPEEYIWPTRFHNWLVVGGFLPEPPTPGSESLRLTATKSHFRRRPVSLIEVARRQLHTRGVLRLPASPSQSASIFRPANGPRNHTVQESVAQDQRVEQYRTYVGKKGGEQKIREDRVRCTQCGIELRARGQNRRQVHRSEHYDRVMACRQHGPTHQRQREEQCV